MSKSKRRVHRSGMGNEEEDYGDEYYSEDEKSSSGVIDSESAKSVRVETVEKIKIVEVVKLGEGQINILNIPMPVSDTVVVEKSLHGDEEYWIQNNSARQ